MLQSERACLDWHRTHTQQWYRTNYITNTDICTGAGLTGGCSQMELCKVHLPWEGRLPMCPDECKWKPQKKQLISFAQKPCGTGLKMTRIFTCWICYQVVVGVVVKGAPFTWALPITVLLQNQKIGWGVLSDIGPGWVFLVQGTFWSPEESFPFKFQESQKRRKVKLTAEQGAG